MQLILRPVSDAQLKEIIVTDSRFAIGRNEEHFKNYDRSVVAKLSRRHARIFERNGHVFIADLHSSNGTTINGQIVEGEPVQLKLNDEIQFGGLRYRVEHLGGHESGTASAQPSVDARIVLKPIRTDGSLDPIVVSKFPFLVSRYSNAFAHYQKAIPQQLSLISKKHAHIFLHQNAFYVEDLGSTNGTFVSGEALSEQARRLEDKDTIAFGGDYFAYEVQTFIGRDTVVAAESEIEHLAGGTIFVDDATNFFEIYMGAGDKDDERDAASPAGAEEGTDPGTRRRRAGPGRVLRFFGELRGSFRGSAPTDLRLRWTIVACVAGLGAGIAGYWYLAWPAQQISKRFDNGQYLAAAELANRYLGRRPDDDRIQDLATEATLKTFVPEWQAAIESGNYTAARRVLAGARQTGSNNPQDDELIAALELATEFSAVELGEGSRDVTVGRLSGDESVRALVQRWDSRSTENARALSRIDQQVEGFDAYQTKLYRKLRALRERDKGLEVLHELRTNIVAALANRDPSRLRQQVRDFAAKHPAVSGLDLLQEDLLRYEAVEQAIDDADWLRAYDRLNENKFNTEPFAEHAEYMNENVLPDARTRVGYEKAAEAWQAGNALESFDILEELARRTWGEVARRDLARNRELLSELVELQDNREAADFEDRLFALYGRLDPERDVFIRRALQPDFQQHSRAALERATDRTRRAEQAWNDYDRAGRLRSVHRLEEQVSPEYRNLAGLLNVAYQYLRESKGIYQQLDISLPDGWESLHRDVVQEIKLQTRALGNLLVIEPELQKAKLELLPDLASS